MSWLKRILGQDGKFYDLLEGSADEAKSSAETLKKILPQLAQQHATAPISELEAGRRRHKRIASDITRELCRNFVTPLEREDIEALSHALYRIPKNIEKIGELLTMGKNSSRVLEKVAPQVKLLAEATETVSSMVHELRKKPHVEQISDTYNRLQTIEGDADKLITERLRELYESEFDVRELMLLKDVYELLEKVIDRCRDAGNIVFQIILKYS